MSRTSVRKYVRTNEATKCSCPRQCRRLAYEYSISQAEISNFVMMFVKHVYNLTNTVNEIKYDSCLIEVRLSLYWMKYIL